MSKCKATAAAIKAACKPISHWPGAILVASASLLSAQGAVATELVVNGSFEEPVVTYEQGWMSYYGENDDGGCESRGEEVCPDETIPGWEIYWRDSVLAGDPQPGRLELQHGFLAGTSAAEGDQKAELDSHYRQGSEDNNVVIVQSLDTCPGSPYTLRYSWKSRTDEPGDNDTLVLIDDELLFTLTAYMPTWTEEEYNFFANDSGVSGVGFTSVGTSTLLGMFIDDVSVTGADGSDPESCQPPPAVCGDKPTALTLLYDADLNGVDKFTQDPDEVSIASFYDTQVGLPHYVRIRVYDHFRKASRRTMLFNELVSIGEIFEVGGLRKKIPPRLFIDIETPKGELLQSVEFHTSCSQPLNVGDEFGGIAIWGFTP